MTTELESWERGLNDLIMRCELRTAEAQQEIRYLEKLERFIDVSKELREVFRSYVTRQPEPIPFDNPEAFAPRFAPNGSGADAMRRVVNGAH